LGERENETGGVSSGAGAQMRKDPFRAWGQHRDHGEPAFVPASDGRWNVDVRGKPRGPAPAHGATQAELEELRAKIDPASPDMATFIHLTRTG
jgi:hypothetical protein